MALNTLSEITINRKTMPKMKTKSSAKKRFKLAFKSHILTKKSKKRKLKLTHDSLVHKADENNIKIQLRLK
jgi:large subunit ribosomal protein L35